MESQIDLFPNPISGGLSDAECGTNIKLIRREVCDEKLHGLGGAVRLLIRSRGTHCVAQSEACFGFERREQRRAAF